LVIAPLAVNYRQYTTLSSAAAPTASCGFRDIQKQRGVKHSQQHRARKWHIMLEVLMRLSLVAATHTNPAFR
jgi:hypothetical protein